MYDLIGDIHGEIDALIRLLDKLGYRSVEGVFRHPSRQVIFLGDFIDRGPGQSEVVDLARAMVESEAALAVMGNHEFNAVGFATEHSDHSGEFLRPHNEKNLAQHQVFLDAYSDSPDVYCQAIHWFRSLPLWLDLPGLRVVHACWSAPDMRVIQPYLDRRNVLKPDAWPVAFDRNHRLFSAVESVLKGPEVPLPDGCSFKDKDGNWRSAVRTRWWMHCAANWASLAIGPPNMYEQLPIGAPHGVALQGYPTDEKPVFIGHYWLSGTPRALEPNVACLDFSVANGGDLVAYRWDGESSLGNEKFVSVPATSP